MTKKLTFAEVRELLAKQEIERQKAWDDYYNEQNRRKTLLEATEEVGDAVRELRSVMWREMRPVLQTCIDMVQYAYEYVRNSIDVRNKKARGPKAL